MGAEDPETMIETGGVDEGISAMPPPVAPPMDEAGEEESNKGKALSADEESHSASSGSSGQASFPIRETSVKLPFFKEKLVFNWFVSICALAILWGIAIFCMASPEDAMAELGVWFDTTILYFNWFYIVGNPVMTFYTFWVAYRYGDIKLGPKDGVPEFSDVSYFAMLFSAGVGVGLFFYGVSEPLWHQSGNYYSETGYRSQNEVDQWAMEITLYHWGFAAWSPYLMTAIAAGLGAYCFNMPLTIRSTFYPLLGEYCWGWIGDIVDMWSIVMTVAGVCTSLGLGVIQLEAGLRRLEWVDPANEDPQGTYIGIIWIITAMATISVVTGLKVGIKLLSMLGFCLGCLILFLCFVMEKSYYLLNVLVQSTGVYLQWSIFQVPFWTDAFGSLKDGEGRAVDGNVAPSEWIGWWTVFYMAWWVSWSCFVGIFIARISKNRSLRNIILGVFLAPTAYSILWFCTMGGIGLRQERQAKELQMIGNVTYGDNEYFQNAEIEHCYDVPQEDIYADDGTAIFVNTLRGITPVCLFNSADAESSWFNVMYSFSYPGTGANGDFAGFGQFMSGLSIFALAIYFITSSDSGSLVVDTLASNGAEEHHWLQRVFWAFTEGAVATGLLVAGGNQALKALQSASIVFGLPFNFFIFLMCWSVKKMCDTLEEHGQSGNMDRKLMLPKKTWSMPSYGGVFNVFEYVLSFGKVHQDLKESGIDFPTSRQLVDFFKNAVIPIVPLFTIYKKVYPDTPRTNMFLTASYALCHAGWIALFAAGAVNYGFIALGWSLFFINACILTSLRLDVRNKLGIAGNIVGDFTVASFLYPQALLQMEMHLEKVGDLAEATETHEKQV